MAKRHHYVLAIIRKAWEEFTLKEAIPEAILGFVSAIYMRRNGLEDEHGQREIIIEAVIYGFLYPFIGFLFRVFFTAPGEIVKELLESRKKDEIDPKSIYPSTIIILLVICTTLTGIVVSNFSKIALAQNQPHTANDEAQKQPAQNSPSKPYIPKTIIKTNVQPEIAKAEPVSQQPNPEPQITNTEPQKTVETFSPIAVSGLPLDTVLASRVSQAEERRIADAKAAAKAKEDHDLAVNVLWTNSLPHFQHAMTVLHDELVEVAKALKANVVQTNYLPTSLPAAIDQTKTKVNIADFGIQNDTNWLFNISIRQSDNGSDPWWILTISCPGGWMVVHLNNDGSNFHRWTTFYAAKYKEINLEDSPPWQPIAKCDGLVEETIKSLIAVNYQYIKESASKKDIKSDTKTLDNGQ